MNQIKSKIYYLISTGEVLCGTPECQGCVEETTKSQDIKIYPQLKDRDINEIDYIELTYGTLASTFTNVKSYKINPITKKLEMIYYSQSEIDAKVEKQKEQQSISDRISLITEYTTLDTTSIEDLEEYILQREQDKITGGI